MQKHLLTSESWLWVWVPKSETGSKPDRVRLLQSTDAQERISEVLELEPSQGGCDPFKEISYSIYLTKVPITEICKDPGPLFEGY